MKAAVGQLGRAVEVIAQSVHPYKVILFGSRARGDNSENSDYDLLILKNNITNEREITQKVYRMLLTENIGIPIDLIAVDTDKYEKLKFETGMIYKTIAREGVVVYE